MSIPSISSIRFASSARLSSKDSSLFDGYIRGKIPESKMNKVKTIEKTKNKNVPKLYKDLKNKKAGMNIIKVK